MKVLQIAAVMLFTIVICAGCDTPTNRAVWSPDGSRMAVLAGDALRVSDQAGNLSQPLIKNVDLVTWLPDSRQAVVVTEAKAQTWKQVSEVLGPEETKQVVAEAKKFLADLVAYPGDWDSFCKREEVDHMKHPIEVITYLREHNLQQLKSKMGLKWKDMDTIACTAYTVQVYELKVSGAVSGAVLYRSLRNVAETRVSPDGKFAAICETSDFGDDGPFRILIVPTIGGATRKVATGASKYPDWTTDGKSLVYIGLADPDSDDSQLQLGYINQLNVLGADNSIPAAIPPAKNLATVLFDAASRVRCLRDGRILFSATKASLPCTGGDIGKQQSLFALDPGRTATVISVVPKVGAQQIGDLVECFEANPDGTKVSIPSQSGKVTVLTLATGEVTDAQAKTDKSWQKLILIPQWRTAEQLCFASPLEKKEAGWHSAEIVLWSPDKNAVQSLSQNWAAEAVNGFLREKDSESIAK